MGGMWVTGPWGGVAGAVEVLVGGAAVGGGAGRGGDRAGQEGACVRGLWGRNSGSSSTRRTCWRRRRTRWAKERGNGREAAGLGP